MAFLFYAFVFVLFKEIGMVDHYLSLVFFGALIILSSIKRHMNYLCDRVFSGTYVVCIKVQAQYGHNI